MRLLSPSRGGEMERGLSIVILVVSRLPHPSFPIASGQELLLKGGGEPTGDRLGNGLMLQAEGAEVPVKVEFDHFEHGFPEGFGPGGWGHLAYAVGIAFAVFQLVIAAWNGLPSQGGRGVHVGFLLLMPFGLLGNFTARSDAGRAAGWLIGAAGFLCGLYQWIFYADLIARDGDPTQLDLAVGTLLAILIFEG